MKLGATLLLTMAFAASMNLYPASAETDQSPANQAVDEEKAKAARISSSANCTVQARH